MTGSEVAGKEEEEAGGGKYRLLTALLKGLSGADLPTAADDVEATPASSPLLLLTHEGRVRPVIELVRERLRFLVPSPPSRCWLIEGIRVEACKALDMLI